MGKPPSPGLYMETLGLGQDVGRLNPGPLIQLWLAPRLDFEKQLEELMSQHKDLWEFHVSHSKPFLPFPPSSLAEPGPKFSHPPGFIPLTRHTQCLSKL